MKKLSIRNIMIMTALLVLVGNASIAFAEEGLGTAKTAIQVISYTPDSTPVTLMKHSRHHGLTSTGKAASLVEDASTETVEYTDKTTNILSTLKSKWAALADALVTSSPETELPEKLREEIWALDSRLAETRLAHLFKTDRCDAIPMLPEKTIQKNESSTTI